MINWKSLTPDKFEDLCISILFKNGYHNIQHLGGSGDRGRDIIAHKKRTIVSSIEKDEKWIGQCKRHIEKPPTISELRKTIDWCIAHKPDGIIFFITNRLSPATSDWIEKIKSEYKFTITIIDIDYFGNELSKDKQLYERFFEKIEIPKSNWYDYLIGPKTHKITIYTAGKMPEETTRKTITKWRKNIENKVRSRKLDVGFFHPEFIGCDHRGINTEETVSIDTHMIQQSDALIAYLNEDELYGTIVEIMIAYSQNKKIAIFIDEKIIHKIPKEFYEALYTEIYKTKHSCPCSLSITTPEYIARNKYWFLLTLLSRTRKDITIDVVKQNNITNKIISIIERWL